MEETIREKLKHWLEHGLIFLKWVACAVLIGLVLGGKAPCSTTVWTAPMFTAPSTPI